MGELAPVQSQAALDLDLLDLANVFLMGVDDEQCIAVLNRQAREFFGDEAIGKPAIDVLDPEKSEQREALTRLTSTAFDTHFYREHHLASPNGTTAIVDWQKHAVPEPTGDIAVVLIGLDAAERAREEALNDREKQMHEMCNALPVLVAYVGTDDRYRFNNAAYQRILGLAPETLKGLHMRDVLDDRAFAAGAPHRQRVKSGEATMFETQIYDREGYLRDVSIHYQPHFDDSGQVVGYFVMSSDVTEQKKLEKALRHSQKLDAVGRLASGSAHDFNNLMMGISGCANMALSRLSESNPARPLIEEIRSASTSGGSIARKLLNFSRTAEADDDLVDIGLDKTIVQHQIMLEHLLPVNISLHLDLAAGHSRVQMAEGHLEQVLMNLVINARDAMPDGGDITIQSRSVELDAAQAKRIGGIEPGPYVSLAITDTGVGMDADTAERSFEPFFTTKEVGKGSGLGLSTVYGNVTKAGGMVTIQSTSGTGTTVASWLPTIPQLPPWTAATASQETADVTRGAEPGARESEPEGRRTVLLVEDDRLVRMTVRDYLVKAGFQVTVAESGTEAVERAAGHQGPLDLLVTDLMLPGMTGVQVANRTRDLHPLVKVLYISAHSRDVLEHAGIHGAGDIDIVQKPFSSKQLLGHVHKMLEHTVQPLH